MNTTAHAATPVRRRRGLHITLWVVQVVLGAMFLMAGIMKLTQPIDAVVASLSWAADVPEMLVRFIGAAEFAGALGLILPSLTRIKPRLTALAAIGLIVLMMLASGFHITRGESAMVPMNLVLAAAAAFVAWGRGKAAPIAPRA